METATLTPAQQVKPDLYVEGVGFFLDGKLGEGGQGVVFSGRSTEEGLKGPLAIKLEALVPSDQEDVDAKARAYRFMHLLGEHGGIAKVFMSGVERHENGTQSMVGVMEEYGKGSLRSWMERNLITNELQKLAVISHVGDAVQHANSKGVVHRDLKPENLLVGEAGTVVIADFGLAILEDPKRWSRLDQARTQAGTPSYMAPEQWAGKPTVFSDQYALGIMAYEIMTGKRPFDRNNPHATAVAHTYSTAPNFEAATRRENTTVMTAVEPIIMQALAKNERNRHLSVAQFMERLEDAAYKAVPADSPDRARFQGVQRRQKAREEISEAYALSQASVHEEALQHYDQAIDLDAKNMRAWYQKAHVLRSLGRHEEATEAFRKAYQCPLREERDFIRRGVILAHFGYHEVALENYREARRRGHIDFVACQYELTSLDVLAGAEDRNGERLKAEAHRAAAEEIRTWIATATTRKVPSVRV